MFAADLVRLPREVMPTFTIKHDNPKRSDVCRLAVQEMQRWHEAGRDFEVCIGEIKRTLDANAAMWATLTDIAGQVDWPHTVGGEWQIGKMGKESWKSVLTAGYQQETAMAQGVGGGTVMVGASTSKFSKRTMGEFLEFAHDFGAERGVRFSAKAKDDLANYTASGGTRGRKGERG